MPAPRKRAASPPPTDIRHEDCWAKTTADGRPGINVRDHCLNVGCVAETLITLLPRFLRDLLPAGVSTLAALHDIGKVSPGFQAKCEVWLVQKGLKDRARGWSVSYEGDHARIGQGTVQKLLQTAPMGRWAAVIGAHHGRVKGEHVQVSQPWEEERLRLAEDLIGRLGPLPAAPPEDSLLWFVAGMTTVADWIGSNEDQFPQDDSWSFEERRRRAEAALAAVGWKSASFRPLLEFDGLFPDYKPDELQAAAIRTIREPGLYLIEGPMGCGKTEAALAAAYTLIASGKASGIYFALPTQVTSNRIFARVKKFLESAADEPAEIRLAHGASWLLDADPLPLLHPACGDDEARNHVRTGRSWFASAKRALLTPFGVGTVDQALLGIVAAKHFFIRQFGLAGKVVILDEVHSYDLYTGTLIDVLVRRLRELRCTVIILSATLTRARRTQLLQPPEGLPLSEAYPLLSGVAEARIEVPCVPPPAKPVGVSFLDSSVLVEKCLERAGHGACVLWIRNTVDDARKTYRDLKAASHQGGGPVALLHSRFPFFRREELETRWMDALGKDSAKRPSGCVLVATQVAEQSVDIDADLLITDLAPTDMLLQRLGRLWRHERPGRGGRREMWIQETTVPLTSLQRATSRELREALGKSAKVYAPYVLLRSLAQWRPRETITLPEDIRAILEATYADPTQDEPESWRELRRDLEKKKEEMARRALSATLVWVTPDLPDDEGVQTRINSYPTAQLLLTEEITPIDSHSRRLRLLDGKTITVHDRDWDFAAAKAIHRNLTPVPRWAVASSLITTPGWLTKLVSRPTALGLRLADDESIRWPGDERETGLAYHPDEGIIIQRERRSESAERDLDESFD